MRLALVDSADGRIGNPIDQVLLYCYQYDPTSGRYSASILNVVRVGGLLTVVGLVAFILSTTLKPRGRARPSGPESHHS
jgi:protein SCO1/2